MARPKSISETQEVRIILLHEDGLSYEAIAEEMEKRGEMQTHGRRKGKPISVSTVRRVVERIGVDDSDRETVGVTTIGRGDLPGEVSAQGGAAISAVVRKSLVDTQSKRYEILVVAEAQMEKFAESGKMGRDVLDAVKTMGSLLKDMDASEDGGSKLQLFFDQRGGGGGASPCPDPGAHEFEGESLGPVVQKLTRWVRDNGGDLGDILDG